MSNKLLLRRQLIPWCHCAQRATKDTAGLSADVKRIRDTLQLIALNPKLETGACPQKMVQLLLTNESSNAPHGHLFEKAQMTLHYPRCCVRWLLRGEQKPRTRPLPPDKGHDQEEPFPVLAPKNQVQKRKVGLCWHRDNGFQGRGHIFRKVIFRTKCNEWHTGSMPSGTHVNLCLL